ncbi:MAG TPA: zinc ribbon domain-containing protein [Pyrinomonadaceae bacterium]|nr:zinc ribbon domain-containing protein [Pyrinomonadaceae bacterium]
MYCPSCGSEITVELKYCNRCGANLTWSMPSQTPPAPISLTIPSLVLGLTVIIGLGIVFGGATSMAERGLHPAAIVWMVLFSVAALFGCVALMIRFWTKLMSLQRESTSQPQVRPTFAERSAPPALPPRMEPVGSVTENTTRTFAPVYSEPPDRTAR